MKIKEIKLMECGESLLHDYLSSSEISFLIEFSRKDKNGISEINLTAKIYEAETIEFGGECWESNGDNLEYANESTELLSIESLEYVGILDQNHDELKSGLKMKYFNAIHPEIIKFLNSKLN